MCLPLALVLASASVSAAQVDIHGPPGSVAFGETVTVLPNGNLVVTDPSFSTQTISHIGAVYLYDPDGNLISTLTGTSPDDYVGIYGVVVVGNGDFVVLSPFWNNGAASGAGAVTWMSGTSGLGSNAVVSAANSLVGTTSQDLVGTNVTVLTNGNYVVESSRWNSGTPDAKVGAATWGNGASGVSGVVSASNSLIGTTLDDRVGSRGVTALANGNYVVASPYWNNGTPNSNIGAATWGHGASGITGPVSASNSLIGTTPGDQVGLRGVTALVNGNFVVKSYYWNNGTPGSHVGAATWGHGASGIAGPVSASNSLIGSTRGDKVGNGVSALANGNFVVVSPTWNNGTPGSAVGAATWGNGASGITGQVSASNSLVGTTVDDAVGWYGVTALSNGNYVVASGGWENGTPDSAVGAATWGNGASGITGPVSTSNSLVGTTPGDRVGHRVTALANGNYVVRSSFWNNGTPDSHVGAATWGNGASGIIGPVSASNSLIGTTSDDWVGYRVTALANGNYVVANSGWNNGTPGARVGAATWGNGASGSIGQVSASNSLIGTSNADRVGNGGVTALADGNFLVYSPAWNSGSIAGAGAITIASGDSLLAGPIRPWNSVRGMVAGGGESMYASAVSYDATRQRLAVGRPAENIVTLITLEDTIFADGFEP